jgi:hypothetical protein
VITAKAALPPPAVVTADTSYKSIPRGEPEMTDEGARGIATTVRAPDAAEKRAQTGPSKTVMCRCAAASARGFVPIKATSVAGRAPRITAKLIRTSTPPSDASSSCAPLAVIVDAAAPGLAEPVEATTAETGMCE